MQPGFRRLDSFQKKLGFDSSYVFADGMSRMCCSMAQVGWVAWGPGILYLSAEQRKTLRDSPEPWDSSAVLGMGGFCFSSRAVELSCWTKYLQHHSFFALEWTSSPVEMSLLLEMFVAPG